MRISGFYNSLSSRLPSYQTLSKVGFGVMGALSPVFAGMAVKSAGAGSYFQSGFFALTTLTALTGPALIKSMESLCKKACSSIFYVQDLSSQIQDVSKRACAVGQRVGALLPKNTEPSTSETIDAGAVVKRVDRALALSESALDKAEWMAKNPVETALLALIAACSYRILAVIALLYGMNELSKKVLNKSNVRQICEVA